ncbi:MAG TPA: TIGR03750 family conjugal transfer protein [Noviherbaspirillum sp.]
MSVTDPRNDAPLTDRVNAEPAILRGLSSTEALIAIGASFAFWIPVSLVIGFAVQHLQVSVIFMGAGPICSVWLLSGWFQKVKRDQPDYVYLHKIKKWGAAKGLLVSRFLSHSGYFDIGRTVRKSINRS